MAGKIVADQLEHSTAGTVSTEYVVDGSAKVWTHYSATALVNSLNSSSFTDNDTGDHTIAFTTSFSNANYSAQFAAKHSNNNALANSIKTLSTGSIVTINGGASNNLLHQSNRTDNVDNCLTIHGDLA
tara:strand:- start:1009 stop:1392 length:384 start_codon:yes stop_codon:yes gene_type:complete